MRSRCKRFVLLFALLLTSCGTKRYMITPGLYSYYAHIDSANYQVSLQISAVDGGYHLKSRCFERSDGALSAIVNRWDFEVDTKKEAELQFDFYRVDGTYHATITYIDADHVLLKVHDIYGNDFEYSLEKIG